ncbi:MAG: hypothetical protein A2Y94_14005 [Caldithrix sp. RBG_13_44_9]|nr:MAG: hypothetical protein A2Y94_14005 [Caldithrix sp. RBG_13_44_9]
MTLRVKQAGDLGHKLLITCTPYSTLVTAINALARPALIIGRFVTIADGYVVALPGDNAVPNGRIEAIEGNSVTGYVLTVHLFCLASQNTTLGFYFTPKVIINVPYTTALAFGDTVQMDGTDGVDVEDAGATVGHGFVLAKDTPSAGYADVAF